jgi:hypothetical protein
MQTRDLDRPQSSQRLQRRVARATRCDIHAMNLLGGTDPPVFDNCPCDASSTLPWGTLLGWGQVDSTFGTTVATCRTQEGSDAIRDCVGG